MSRIALWWKVVGSSLWFLPSLLTLGACGLAALTIWIDQHQIVELDRSWFILVSGAEGARGVLSTIAGSIITVTGVVFSITIVVLQLASSQYSPRVLRSFTEDRTNQLVLGVFIGTFTYALLVLRTVRSAFDDYDRFVPSFSVNVAVVLALVSIGFLIYFINHIAESIQSENIIARVTQNALQVISVLFPERIGRGAQAVDPQSALAGHRMLASIEADQSGYLQGIDDVRIMTLAETHDVALRLEQPIGAFVIEGDVVVTVHALHDAQVPADELLAVMRLGAERTRHQDVERTLIELTDIAVRALSPGVNDPTTAVVCIQRLTEILTALGERHFPPLVRTGQDGAVRVITQRVSFSALLTGSFGEIMHHGRNNPRIADQARTALRRLVDRLPAERARAVIEYAASENIDLA